jgi:hypothetical protein
MRRALGFAGGLALVALACFGMTGCVVVGLVIGRPRR